MRWAGLLSCALLLSGGVAAAAPLLNNVGLIVAGQSIGPLRIGMTAAQVRGAAAELPCDIAVAYADGRVSRLETNCGVAYQTPDGITVGLDGSRIWWAYGRPDQATPSNFAGTRADWLLYRGPGIGFRVIYAEGNSLIQAIAIFKGTGAPVVVRPGPAPPPVPAPVVGD